MQPSCFETTILFYQICAAVCLWQITFNCCTSTSLSICNTKFPIRLFANWIMSYRAGNSHQLVLITKHNSTYSASNSKELYILFRYTIPWQQQGIIDSKIYNSLKQADNFDSTINEQFINSWRKTTTPVVLLRRWQLEIKLSKGKQLLSSESWSDSKNCLFRKHRCISY